MKTKSAYEISNGVTEVRLKSFRNTESKDVLNCDTSAKERHKKAVALLAYLSTKFKINMPSLLVTDNPRPIKGRGQIGGWYVVNDEKIIIYNTTAKTHKPISIKMFYETLLHEFMHHYDYKVLKLNDSLHTAGFYNRISDLKNKLS